jgi:hypothetical protein
LEILPLEVFCVAACWGKDVGIDPIKLLQLPTVSRSNQLLLGILVEQSLGK